MTLPNESLIEFLKKQGDSVWHVVITKDDAFFEDDEGRIIDLTSEQWNQVVRLMDKSFEGFMSEVWEILYDCVREVLCAPEG